jgi:hypothetical protein
VEKRNYTLRLAYDNLTNGCRELLVSLALLRGGADYSYFLALNPFLNPNKKIQLNQALETLKRSGLLEFDLVGRIYKLHPVVRSYVLGFISSQQKTQAGAKALDYFNQAIPDLKNVDEISDLNPLLQRITILIQLSRIREAAELATDSLFVTLSRLDQPHLSFQLSSALLDAIEALPKDEENKPGIPYNYMNIKYYHASLLIENNQFDDALQIFFTILDIIIKEDYFDENPIYVVISDIARTYKEKNNLYAQYQWLEFAIELARYNRFRYGYQGGRRGIFNDLFYHFVITGQYSRAEEIWREADQDKFLKDQEKHSGENSYEFLLLSNDQNTLTLDSILEVKRQLSQSNCLRCKRSVKKLEANWYAGAKRWREAYNLLTEILAESSNSFSEQEQTQTLLLRCRICLNDRDNLEIEYERIKHLKDPHYLGLAKLAEELGKREDVVSFAAKAYKEAWMNGPPYCYSSVLEDAKKILEEYDAQIPVLPPFNPERNSIGTEEFNLMRRIRELFDLDGPSDDDWLLNEKYT